MVELIYGSGLRISKFIRLQVKDIDYGMNQKIVRDGKGKQSYSTFKGSKHSHFRRTFRLSYYLKATAFFASAKQCPLCIPALVENING
jgi:site-specific recombinase XerD